MWCTTILGPLFYFYFKSCSEVLYADDATLTKAASNIEIIQHDLSSDVHYAFEWCLDNDMILNLPKCVFLLIATNQKLKKYQDIKLNVNINNVDLPCVSSTKILGVHFDSNFSWKEHVAHIRKKISKNLLKRIKFFYH